MKFSVFWLWLGWLPTAPLLAQSAAPVVTPSTARLTPSQQGIGIDPANIDPSVPPCADFYHYANGNWLKKNPIPAAETRWGSYNELDARNSLVQKTILEGLARSSRTAAPGCIAQKVGDYYASGMDTVAIDVAGLRYLRPHLARIAAIRTLPQMQQFLADPTAQAGSVWYRRGVSQDEKHSTQYAVHIYQGGLTLPDRDYYLSGNARLQAIRAAYQVYVASTFRLLGDAAATAARNAAAVVRLETRLAQASRSRTALRDPQQNYNQLTVAQLAADYPNLAFPLTLRQAGLGAAQKVIVGQPEYLKQINAMLATEPIADQRQYLRWHLVTSLTSALPRAFGDESFRFWQLLSGAQRPQPRWKRMLRATDEALGEALGQFYVAKAFPPAAKVRVKEMVDNLRMAYAGRIRATDWMSPATKQEALAKLDAFVVKIGYPDQWKDYSALRISRGSYLNNVVAARIWARADEGSYLGRPIDRGEWGMTPPTPNAYYDPSGNEIVFPAGILQPPFYDPGADDAVNYGGIGALIGHEMTHGFDDHGRQYDAQGNLRDWWTPADADQFNARAARLGQQYSGFTVLDSLHVNGDLTMGENLADLGGLTIAYQAFQKTEQFKAGLPIAGFTPAQRFFLGYAQSERANIRPEALRQRLQTDEHAPNQYRVNGPLLNMPEFYQAFGCKFPDQMTRPAAEQARIW